MAVKRIADGSRVHHAGGIYSRQHNGGGTYWGTVLRSIPQHDGSYEYEVQPDAALAGFPNDPTWWGSHHIDRVIEPSTSTKEEAT